MVFLGLSVLDLGPMYATDVRQTDVRQKHRLMSPPIRGRDIITVYMCKHVSQVQRHIHRCGNHLTHLLVDGPGYR